jgi:hypothetical protein
MLRTAVRIRLVIYLRHKWESLFIKPSDRCVSKLIQHVSDVALEDGEMGKLSRTNTLSARIALKDDLLSREQNALEMGRSSLVNKGNNEASHHGSSISLDLRARLLMTRVLATTAPLI